MKSARLSVSDFIVWNFDIGDWIDLPHPLYHEIPQFLRVCKIKLVTDMSGAHYAKCNCGERKSVGVPCPAFFKVCEDAEVPDNDMIHPCMMDVRYMKVYHTHYGKTCDLGDLVMKDQKDSFNNEGKGAEITAELMNLL